jgi:hypothetical protein
MEEKYKIYRERCNMTETRFALHKNKETSIAIAMACAVRRQWNNFNRRKYTYELARCGQHAHDIILRSSSSKDCQSFVPKSNKTAQTQRMK